MYQALKNGNLIGKQEKLCERDKYYCKGELKDGVREKEIDVIQAADVIKNLKLVKIFIFDILHLLVGG